MRFTITPIQIFADLVGNAEMSKGNVTFKGPTAQFKVYAREVEMKTPSYELRDNRATGTADKLTIQSSDIFVFDNATYSTCTPQK